MLTNVKRWVLLLILMGFSAVFAQQSVLMRFPDIYDGTIVFVQGEDIWTVPAQGGDAIRLTMNDGQERYPKFSPDGTQIAFTGE